MSLIDWNATAAWTAVIVSIGTVVVVPLLTSIINGLFQLLIRKFDARDRRKELGVKAIDSAISSIGNCASNLDKESLQIFGKNFFGAYPYVNSSQWSVLNDFYSYVIDGDTDVVSAKAPIIISLLTDARKRIVES